MVYVPKGLKNMRREIWRTKELMFVDIGECKKGEAVDQ